jgi:protein MpaA
MARPRPGPFLALCLVAWLIAGPSAADASRRVVIGHSVLGRPIPARVLGRPRAPERVVVFGCIHGNETAGIRVARRLVAAEPPHDARLWVVPSLNPDGVAAGTRGNARGVDLNRNFPFHWRPLPGLEYSGPAPLSEPESRAAARLIRRVRPDVTIWFHQPFDLVDRPRGDPAVARRFAELVGLPMVRLRRYPGSASSWQSDALPGSTAFVVELPAVVGGALVSRAARAVDTVAAEYGRPGVGAAASPGLTSAR